MTEVENLLKDIIKLDRLSIVANTPINNCNNKTLEQIYNEKGIEAIKDYLERLLSYVPGSMNNFMKQWYNE
jgi:hypothetical protein